MDGFPCLRGDLEVTVDAEEIEDIHTVGRVLQELLAEHAQRARLTAPADRAWGQSGSHRWLAGWSR